MTPHDSWRPMRGLVLVLLLLTGCGEEPSDAVPATAEPTTLHVRAAGMVASLGIT